jgi:hypothetical protein
VVADVPVDKYLVLVYLPLGWIVARVLGRRAGIANLQSPKMGALWPQIDELARAGVHVALSLDGYDPVAWVPEGLGTSDPDEISRPPPDLALYPFGGTLRAHLLRRMRDQRLPKGVVHYRRGSDAHQCGLCTMFLRVTERCTLVSGVIEADMTCDKFERK